MTLLEYDIRFQGDSAIATLQNRLRFQGENTIAFLGNSI